MRVREPDAESGTVPAFRYLDFLREGLISQEKAGTEKE
jgi:hypothetical protein